MATSTVSTRQSHNHVLRHRRASNSIRFLEEKIEKDLESLIALVTIRNFETD